MRGSRTVLGGTSGEVPLVYSTKAAWYDKDVVMISRWEPSTKKCSNCAQIKDMKLSERIYSCDSCGFIAERDLNAALNIKAAGRAVRGAACQPGGQGKR